MIAMMVTIMMIMSSNKVLKHTGDHVEHDDSNEKVDNDGEIDDKDD